MIRLAADPAQRALGGAKRELLHRVAAGEDILVDHHCGIGAHRKLGAIDELEGADARGIGADALVAVNGIAPGERAALTADLDRDVDSNTDLFGRERRNAERHCRKTTEEELRGNTRSSHAVTPLKTQPSG